MADNMSGPAMGGELTGAKRARKADTGASRRADEELIKKVVDTALCREKEQRYADMLTGLEKLEKELKEREAAFAVCEDAVVKRELAVMIEEEKNKTTAAELKDKENTTWKYST